MNNDIGASQFALDLQGLERLRQQAAADPQAGVGEAARQFEALFLQIMLKSMRDAIPETGMLDSSATRMYESMLDQQWSQELAGQGLGLAEILSSQLLNSGENGR